MFREYHWICLSEGQLEIDFATGRGSITPRHYFLLGIILRTAISSR